MKILFLAGSFYPSIGGVETHVLEVAKELVRRGHSVSIVTEDKQSVRRSDNKARKSKRIGKSSYFRLKKLDQISIYYFKFGQKNFFKKFYIWYVLYRNIHLFENADIIHAHDVFIWYLPLRFLLVTKKIFTTFHGYEGVFPPAEKAKLIRRLTKKLSWGTINVGDFIEKWYGTKPDFVTYGGVKKVKNKNAKVKIASKKLKVLLVGRLEKDIGILIYKDALRILRERGFDYDLAVCGDGSLRPEIESYGALHGEVGDISLFIKKTDIVFASSYLTMLQALQLGKPVFAVYTNPLKHDYLRMSPFEKYVIISGSAQELVKQVVRYKPNIKKLESALQWANGQTWEKVTQLYHTLWEK